MYESAWDGRPAILKVRRPKEYRDAALDARIRKQRTAREARMIQRAKSAGVPAPIVYFVDVGRSSIVMQLMPGRPASLFSGSRLVELSGQMGRAAGMLHAAGIMHGDLTTANFVAPPGGGPACAIDFGLSASTGKPEDHAVDLRLFREVLGSAHVEEMGGAWDKFMSEYASAVGGRRAGRIAGLVSAIEARGRYASVV